jgi:hypothetical protein
MNRSIRTQAPSHAPFFAFVISIAVLAMLAAGI